MAKFYSLKYGTDPNEQTPAGGMLWGFPEMLEVDESAADVESIGRTRKEFQNTRRSASGLGSLQSRPKP